MGIYLNPNNTNFAGSLKNPMYIDKTMMLHELNHFIDIENKYICVSRPRRFGKTIAGNMIAAYYSKGCDSRKLFAPYKIAKDESFAENLNKFNVIQIDMNSEFQNYTNKDNLLSGLTKIIKAEMRREFQTIELDDEDSIAQCILKIYSATGETFIIIIDEYDVLVREQVSEKLFSEYLVFLNGLFKSNTLRPAIALAYLTGILPVVRDKVQSKLNNFREYTILNAGVLAEFIGFTSQEVEELCKKCNMDFEECRRWYDGYHQGEFDIYNPESVVCSMEDRTFDSYWSKTSSYEVISDRIKQNFAGTKDDVIRMISDESVDVNVSRYLNTMDSFCTSDDLFTYLIHVGYLAYNREDARVAFRIKRCDRNGLTRLKQMQITPLQIRL